VIVDRAGWHMTKAIRCFQTNQNHPFFQPSNTKFKKQLNQKTPLSTTQILCLDGKYMVLW
jgi:hypothetical protein